MARRRTALLISFTLDASIAAARFLPDEQHAAADRLMSEIRSTVGLVPALFWFETRNLFLVAERSGRLRPGEPLLPMTQFECCRSRTQVPVETAWCWHWRARYTLTAYDASHVALPERKGYLWLPPPGVK